MRAEWAFSSKKVFEHKFRVRQIRPNSLCGWHAATVWRPCLSHIRIPGIVSTSVRLPISCFRRGGGPRRMRKIFPEHIDDLCSSSLTESAVSWKSLKHSETVLQHELLVVHCFSTDDSL